MGHQHTHKGARNEWVHEIHKDHKNVFWRTARWEKIMHWPGVEPGSTAWKATMLTVTPPMLRQENRENSAFCSVSLLIEC